MPVMPEPTFTKLVDQQKSPPIGAATAVSTTFEATAPASSPSDDGQNPTVTTRRSRQHRRNKMYRGGFSTSICDFFSDATRRTDCCSLACCGVLSADRNRYLLNNQQTPPWWRRIVVNICLPLFLYLIDKAVVQYVETETAVRECQQVFPNTGEQPRQNYDDASRPDLTDLEPLVILHLVLVVVLICVIVFLLGRAASKRRQFRNDFIDRLYRRDHGTQEETDIWQVEANRTTHRIDTSTATRTCGCCYAAPDLNYLAREIDGDGDEQQDGTGGDLCSCLWNFVASLCCGACCGAWCQCCGMCATGQEEREVNLIVSEEARKIDYISFEPYSHYFPSIENLRRIMNGSFAAHYKALSRLSVNLVKGLGIILAFLLLFALTEIDSKFTYENMLVVLATLFQAFLVLYFVHWKWHRFDLSLDAVVKFFASGFLISTSTAIIIEMLVSFVVGACMVLIGFFALIFEAGTLVEESSDPNDFVKTFVKENAWLGVLFMFLNAFVVAALIEELCKYFGFWMVEHPDLLPEQEGASTQSTVDEDKGQMDTTFAIGDEDEEANSDDDLIDQTGVDVETNEMQKSLNSTGMGITIAMVTTAMGFTCCENLKYVFSSQDVETELATLLLRSIVPVHALAAAIQSIGVCRRDLEGDKSFKLGRIILPAVLLHGSFDFFLMTAPVLMLVTHVDEPGEDYGLSELDKKYNEALATCMKYDAVDEDKWKPKGPYHEDAEKKLSQSDIVIMGTTFGLTLLSLIIGIVWYVVESRKQKVRLEDLEAARRQNASEGSTRVLV